ncbi:MAG: bacteriophage T4 gp5 trimerization domain-containing protein, partial [Thermoanaerobaculia bacterium]
IGQEVVVSFLEGDPDRPLITGSVYNAEQTVPYTLPTDQTKSTIKSNVSKGGGGFNEFRFEDKKDSEEVFLQAQKDLNTVVKNDETHKVGTNKEDGKGDQTIEIYNKRTVTLEKGTDKLQIKEGDRDIDVDKGNETHDVAGTRTLKVTKKETHTSEDEFVHNVTKNYTLKIDGDLSITVAGKVTFKSTGDMTLETSGKLTAKATGDLLAQGMNVTNKATTDLKGEAMNITNKASLNLTNEGAMVKNKASGMHDVEAGGILTVKGSLVKIN